VPVKAAPAVSETGAKRGCDFVSQPRFAPVSLTTRSYTLPTAEDCERAINSIPSDR